MSKGRRWEFCVQSCITKSTGADIRQNCYSENNTISVSFIFLQNKKKVYFPKIVLTEEIETDIIKSD
jgi:hypothetical protein